MKFTLTTILTLAAAAPSALGLAEPRKPGPKCNPHPSCARQARHSKWVVEHFSYNASYIFSTPSHQNSHGYVAFDLWNTASPQYTASCSATSDQLTDFFYGTQWYPCVLPASAPAGAAVSFRFDRPAGRVDVNGTVVCTEGGITSLFPVEGTTQLRLACIDTTWTNPNYTYGSGEFYSDREVKCVPDQCVG